MPHDPLDPLDLPALARVDLALRRRDIDQDEGHVAGIAVRDAAIAFANERFLAGANEQSVLSKLEALARLAIADAETRALTLAMMAEFVREARQRYPGPRDGP